MEVHVISAPWYEHQQTLKAIRTEVFVEEQNVPRDLEWDGLDEDAEHFLAINSAGQHLGCARLLPDGQIGRMAVRADYRKQGIGNRLLDAAVAAAVDRGLDRVFLHAQESATDFYRRGGFLPVGEPFMEAGIRHIGMERYLPMPFEGVEEAIARPTIAAPPAATVPAYGGAAEPFKGEAQALDALLLIAGGARRDLWIYSQDLDPTLFDNVAVIDRLSAFARQAANAEVRVLLHSSRRLVGGRHRLLALARRLESKIRIRRVPEDLATDEHTALIADSQSYWLMPDHTVYFGLSNVADPVRVERLRERFDYLWDRSESDPELRLLQI
jgi:predicted GNAT family N-acyltransferase